MAQQFFSRRTNFILNADGVARERAMLAGKIAALAAKADALQMPIVSADLKTAGAQALKQAQEESVSVQMPADYKLEDWQL